MSRVLILGGTGAMGRYLSGMLADAGHEVCVTTRSSQHVRNGFRYLVGDGHDIGFVRKVICELSPDAIVDFMAYTTVEFLDRYQLMCSGTRHYLFLSSYRVFAGEFPIKEESPRLIDSIDDPEYLKSDEYGLSKARQENILTNSQYKNWTILRPSITYSKNRFQFGCLEANTVCFRALQGLPVVIPSEMLNRYTTLTWGRDAAMLISRLVLNPQAMCEVFDVVTSESHTWREVAGLYGKYIGLKVKEVSLDEYCQICNKYQVKYDRMFDRVLNNEKVKKATGVSDSDFTPLAEGLRRELAEFVERPLILNPTIRQNALIDRLCGTRINLDGFTKREKVEYWRLRYKWFELLYAILMYLRRVVRMFI